MGLFSGNKFKKVGDTIDKFHRVLSSHFEGFGKTFKEHLKSDEAKQIKEKPYAFLGMSENTFNKLSNAEKKALAEHAAKLHAMKKAMIDHGVVTHNANNVVGNLADYIHELALSKVEGREPSAKSLRWAHQGLAASIPEYSRLFVDEPGWKKKAALGTVGGALGGAGLTLAAKSVYDYLKSKKEEEKPSEEEQQQ